MKVKTYTTQSLQQGLEDIKRDLGSDALILSTKSVKVRPRYRLFKKPGWQITAASEEKLTTLAGNAEPSPAASQRPLADGEASAQRPASSAAVAVAPALEPVLPRRDPRMEELIGEIAALNKSLRSISKAIPSSSESGSGMFAELVNQGIDHDFADHLVATASRGKPAPSELRDRIRRLMADQIIIAPPAELYAKTRVVSAFVGPTGVGKTTTIAKIAGHASIRMRKKVAMISTDISRIGGQEQLSRFGQLLGIPTYGCADVAALKDLVDSLDEYDLVLIDTAGSSPSDLARLAKLEAVTSTAGAKVHLVLSATTRSEDITKIVIRFQRFSPNSVIFTKIDETDAKGTIAGDLHRNDLALSYLTNGQRVPEDLLVPSAEDLARFVLSPEPAI